MAERGQQVATVLVSAGRPELLAEIVELSRAQRGVANRIVVCVPDEGSLPPGGLPDDVVTVFARGLAAQRNRGLAAVGDAELVFYFDDDAVPRDDYLELAVDFFARHPEAVALTGRVLADGATGEEISRTDADALLAGSRSEDSSGQWSRSRELYGCNMAFRTQMLVATPFDERLPLYSWLEDHDVARRLLTVGVLARTDDCVVVHRGTKSGGRTAHLRLGYSQVMNPAWFHRKGSFPLWLVAHETLFRCGKNLIRAAGGPESSWRRRRLEGNLLALADIVRGRRTPERILELPLDDQV